MADKTTQEAFDKVASWLSSENGLEIDETGGVTIEGDPPLELAVTADDERVVITHIFEESGAGAGRADAIISQFPDRGTTLRAAAAVDRSGVTITVTNHVYVDGLSRQSLITALHELVGAVDRIGKQPLSETRIQEPVETAATDTSQTDTTATAIETTSGWSPTHRVPSAGMRAWAEPDPSQQPTTRLEPAVELVVSEQRGDWANVVGSNGWTGWVDARQLLLIGAAPTAKSSINLGGVQLRPLPLIGAAALLLSAFLPWVSGLTSVNSLDIAFSFLWDLNASGSPYLGWAIIAIAAGALVVSATKQPAPPLMTLLGVLAVGLTGAFLIQMYRGITDTGGTFGDLFDWIGIAPWVSLGAGVVLIAGAKK
jgi:hypothetical protein